MKGKFDIAEHIAKTNTYLPINLVEDKIKEKANYAVLCLSSTGLNGPLTQIHEPIRITIQEYMYDEIAGQYVEGKCFDRLVQCSKRALKAAIDNKDEYDVFREGGIDLDAYIRGDNVITQADAKADLLTYLSSIDPSIQFVIGNSLAFIKEFLNKIDVQIQDSDKNTTIINRELTNGKDIALVNQTSLTYYYFNRYAPNKDRVNKLEMLMKYLATERGKGDIISEYESKYKGTELRVRYIHTFIDEIAESVGALEKNVSRLKEIINPEDYEQRKEQSEQQEDSEEKNEKTGPEEEKSSETSESEEDDKLSDEEISGQPLSEEQDAFYKDDSSEIQSIEENEMSSDYDIDSLQESKSDIEKTEDESEQISEVESSEQPNAENGASTEEPPTEESKENASDKEEPSAEEKSSDYNSIEETSSAPIYKFYIDALVDSDAINPEKVNDRTSDSDFSKLCNLRKNAKGFTILKVLTSHEDIQKVPILVCLFNISYKDNGEYEKKALIKAVRISNSDIIDLEEKEYDTFAKNGLNADDFRSGNKVMNKDALASMLSKFFNTFPISDYPLISDDRLDNGRSKSQLALNTIGNLPEFTADFIDINKALAEYLYLTLNNDKYNKNVVLKNPLAYADDVIDVRSISENFEHPCKSVTDEAQFAAFLVKNIEKQQAKLFPEEYRKEDPETDRRGRSLRDRGERRGYPPRGEDRPYSRRRPDEDIPRRRLDDENEFSRRLRTSDDRESEYGMRRRPPEENNDKPRFSVIRNETYTEHGNDEAMPESFDRLMGRNPESEEKKYSHSDEIKTSDTSDSGVPVHTAEPSSAPVSEHAPKDETVPNQESETQKIEDDKSETQTLEPAKPVAETPVQTVSNAPFAIPETANMTDTQFREAIIEVAGMALQAIAQQNQIINNMQKNQDSFVNVLSQWMNFVIEDKQRNFSPIEILHRAQGAKDGEDLNDTAVKNLQTMKEELMIISEAVNNTQLEAVLEQATASLEKGQEILHSLKDGRREEKQQKDGD